MSSVSTTVVTSSVISTATTTSTSSVPGILDPLATRTTLRPNATVVPAPPQQCGQGILTIQDYFPACAILATNVTVNVMNNCCKGAPVVAYNNNCNLWCEARNQTLAQLNSCLLATFRASNSSSPILCNRNGASYSSLLPEETADPATRTTPTGSATIIGSGSTSATTGSSPAASSGAASRIRGAPLEGSLSLGAIATVALLAIGGFSSLLI